LTKKELEKYLKEGVLKITADFWVQGKVVKHCEAQTVFEVKQKGDDIELTFIGLD
jgi:hypothetical protein